VFQLQRAFSATNKSHHNVGGLPDFMKLKVVEPLKMLFKDEVRRVGASMNMDHSVVRKTSFSGPRIGHTDPWGYDGLKKCVCLQEVDAIFINNLKSWNLYDKVWQAGAMLLPVNSVGCYG
jgi:GMP synthase (glutamine-hydrolysing)